MLTINLDDQMLRKVLGYSAQSISVSFPADHGVLCTDTHHVHYCGWKAVRTEEERQWVSDRNRL